MSQSMAEKVAPSKEIIAELNRLGVKSAYELCQRTMLVSDGETEVVIPNPQITICRGALTISFYAATNVISRTVHAVYFATHLNEWHLKDAPGCSFQGKSKPVSVSVLES